MTLPSDPSLHKLQFYATTAYACGYIDGRMAQSLIAAPHHLITTDTYSGLIQLGFRRSGKFTYRPHCENCNACIPVRLPIATFIPSRSQKRAYKRHNDLVTTITPLGFSEEHFQLYTAYQAARHQSTDKSTEKGADNNADNSAADKETAEQYRNFLVQSNVESMLVEFRLQGVLKMVSVIDVVQDGVSAVYTFYDTTDKSSSYGTYNILWLAEHCHSLNLPYLYLGYWIRESRKMTYKQNFMPQEALIDGEWQPLRTEE